MTQMYATICNIIINSSPNTPWTAGQSSLGWLISGVFCGSPWQSRLGRVWVRWFLGLGLTVELGRRCHRITQLPELLRSSKDEVWAPSHGGNKVITPEKPSMKLAL